MRIGGGRHRGRQLRAPEGLEVRPTGARTREALFGILLHGQLLQGQLVHGQLVQGRSGGGARFADGHLLDAFAGTGALGLEALSRGAGRVTFMESQPAALAALGRNIETLGEASRATVLACDVLRPPPAPEELCAIVLMDPPYNQGLGPPALVALQAAGWLAEGALCVVELLAKEPFEAPAGFEPLDERKYSKARLVFLRAP